MSANNRRTLFKYFFANSGRGKKENNPKKPLTKQQCKLNQQDAKYFRGYATHNKIKLIWFVIVIWQVLSMHYGFLEKSYFKKQFYKRVH